MLFFCKKKLKIERSVAVFNDFFSKKNANTNENIIEFIAIVAAFFAELREKTFLWTICLQLLQWILKNLKTLNGSCSNNGFSEGTKNPNWWRHAHIQTAIARKRVPWPIHFKVFSGEKHYQLSKRHGLSSRKTILKTRSMVAKSLKHKLTLAQ